MISIFFNLDAAEAVCQNQLIPEEMTFKITSPEFHEMHKVLSSNIRVLNLQIMPFDVEQSEDCSRRAVMIMRDMKLLEKIHITVYLRNFLPASTPGKNVFSIDPIIQAFPDIPITVCGGGFAVDAWGNALQDLHVGRVVYIKQSAS